MNTTTDLHGLSAVDLAALVNTGQLRPVDVVEAAVERIAAADTTIRAFREVWRQRALQAAKTVEARLAAGGQLPLAGVPLGIKASEGLESLQARRLIAAGCVPIGTTSVPRGTPWQTWGYTDRGPTSNPWRSDRSPGGSSAGSAAAVAIQMVPLATGNDGAGSVRIPAAWCGVVGVKTTTGRLPARDRAGLNAPGPLARTVADATAYLGVILGTDLRARVDAVRDRPVRALWSSTLGYADVNPHIAAIARAAADTLAATGVIEWVEHDLVLHDPQHAWQSQRGADPDPRASQIRRDNDRRLSEAFHDADVLLTPTTPHSAHSHGGPGETMSVALTWAFNLSGHPAASVPAGFDPDGIPVGLQIVSRHHDEVTLLQVAAAAPQPPAVTCSHTSRGR